jgi:hypothetical protein
MAFTDNHHGASFRHINIFQRIAGDVAVNRFLTYYKREILIGGGVSLVDFIDKIMILLVVSKEFINVVINDSQFIQFKDPAQFSFI